MRGQRVNERVLGRYKALFEPKSLAVIGVSTHNDRHPANVIFNKNRLHYPLKVYAVNPSGGRLLGEPVYRSVPEIPEKVDLAVIVVRAEQVKGVLVDCIEAGAGAGVIISGGFAEVGRSDLQEEIAAVAREADFPFLGPNCIGMFSPPYVDTNFIANERMIRPNPGNIALVSQSGGILLDLMIKLTEEGVGLSRAVSIGNKVLIREMNLLDYFVHDDLTRVIAFYVEGFGKGEGRTFLEAAAKCPKPIIVFKSGKSPMGTTAVSSHTASLAGDYRVFSAALAQFGVLEAKGETELVNFCESLSRYRAPIKGNIGIVTGSGGHGVRAVDLCAALGLSVPALPAEVEGELRSLISPTVQAIASLRNPFDLTGSATDEDFAAAMAYLCSRPEIDCVIALLLPYMPGISMDLGARLSFVAKQMDKMLVAYVPHVEKYRILIEGFELNGVPVAHSVEGAVLMAEAMRRWGRC
jgi:acyl-CoA synthetase (NDP forming)